MCISFFSAVTLLGESASNAFFLKVSWGAVLLAGLSFFLLGIMAGWLIWGAYQGRAKSVEKQNDLLLNAQEERERAFEEHRKEYAHFDSAVEDSPSS